MNLIEAIVLGLIQGLTEFLPVSSSGHLEVGKYLFGIDHESNFYFSVAVHGATLASTFLVLFDEIKKLFNGIIINKQNDEKKYLIRIFISMIPVAVAGLFIEKIAHIYFTGNMLFLGINFFLTSLLLTLTIFIRPQERPMTFLDSFIIGIAQAFAVLPGISRSGATIATGMMIGNKKSDIAQFSFLMVIIPIMAVNIIELSSGNISFKSTAFFNIIAGSLTAFISGYLACKWMINLVKKGNLGWFAIYCFLIGTFTILLGLNVI